MCLLWAHHRGAMSQEHTCCMRSQSHERSWPSLLKLKFGNGWFISKCCGSSCKKFNSGFQFQFQFQGFQFQFHFQFYQFQFQFQFRNWNWNWPAIPIPELNWPQPWSCISLSKCGMQLPIHSQISTVQPLKFGNGYNKQFSQMPGPLVALHKPAGDQDRPPKVLHVFEDNPRSTHPHGDILTYQ